MAISVCKLAEEELRREVTIWLVIRLNSFGNPSLKHDAEKTNSSGSQQYFGNMDLIGIESIPDCKNACSSSFEVYAAVGGDPDTYDVEDLFIATSASILDIESEDDQVRLSAEVDVIDCEKMGVYFGSSDGIVCFSITITILVNPDDGDLIGARATAEELTKVAESAITKGEFHEKTNNIEAEIEVLLMELSPDSFPNDAIDSDDCASSCDEEVNDDCVASCDEDNNDVRVALCDEDLNDACAATCDDDENDSYEGSIDVDDFNDDNEDDEDDASSMGSTEFDGFLEMSYREYLKDVNRQKIVARIDPSKSPPTVSDFPPECSENYTFEFAPPCAQAGQLKPRTSKVKFDPLVRVTNTLSRHDMTPKELYSYWSGPDEFMTKKERNRMLKLLTEKWTIRKEKEQSLVESKDDIENSLSSPILPQIKRLLPRAEREGHDGYTYTISIKS